MKKRINCGIFISDEGFGHMVRQRAIIKELINKYPSIIITVFTSKNIFYLKETFENRINYLNIPMHLNDNDYVTALISFGTDSIVGGETVYYNGTSEDALESQILSVHYQHGILQISFYDNIYHGANPWINGQRGVLNLSIQKNLLEHFYQEGDHYYNQYIQACFPSGDFVAT